MSYICCGIGLTIRLLDAIGVIMLCFLPVIIDLGTPSSVWYPIKFYLIMGVMLGYEIGAAVIFAKAFISFRRDYKSVKDAHYTPQINE